MKKRIYAILMALLLSTVTLAGCGDTDSGRSSRDRYEEDDDDDNRKSSKNKDDDDDRKSSSSSKGSSSKKNNYLDDFEGLAKLDEAMEGLMDYDYEDEDELNDMIADVKAAIKKFKPITSEGEELKSDLEDMVDILEKMMKNLDDGERVLELYDDLQDSLVDYMEHLEDFYDAAEAAGVDEDDLEELLN